MRKWVRFTVSVFGILLPWSLAPVSDAKTTPTPPSFSAKAAELVDAASGRVLFGYHAHRKLPMASVTKLMTLYLVCRAIQQKRANVHEYVAISDDAFRVNGSQIWLEPGEHISIDHLLKGVAVASANDAAYALAEFFGGSEARFVSEMNRTAKILGMTDTHFANPHGLDWPDHYTTARDMAKLAQAAVKIPLLMHYTSMRQDRSVRDGKGGQLWMVNHNRLLGSYPGTDGLKTGYTTEAGYCLVATARRGATRMVAVVLGAPSSKARFESAQSLMSWGFEHYQTVHIANHGQQMGTVAVKQGVARTVGAVMPQALDLTVARGQASSIKVHVRLAPPLTAPVRQGQVVGSVIVTENGKTLATRRLLAAQAVSRSQVLGRVLHHFLRLIG